MSQHAPWYEDEDCIQCDQPLTHTDYPEDSEFIGEPGSGAIYERVDGGEIGHLCLYCRESWDEHSSTAMVYQNGTQIADAHFGDGIAFDIGYHAAGDGFAGNDMTEVLHGLARGESYIKTDGWRGYTSQTTEAGGFKRVESGSLLFGRETSASELGEAIKIGDVAPNYPIIITIGTTSNVMAQTMDVYVPEDKTEHFKEICSEITR